MKISVFTPTNNPAKLAEAYGTLTAQTHTDWEWVVAPNGPDRDAIAHHVQALAGNDARVRVFVVPPVIKGIGALKRFACDRCTGAAYLELDHDDLLTENCLAEVAAAIEVAGPLAFVYSEAVTLNPKGESSLFTTDYGWRRAAGVVLGTPYEYNLAPPVTARSISEILYAPDHVRVWTAEAYRRAGGHDSKLHVGDDHDLVVRTYLAGVPFHHIPKPLYLHRIGTGSVTNNPQKIAQIGAVSRATRDRHLYALAVEWCRREHLPMYDLGGAHNSPAEYKPIDLHLPEGHPGRGDVFDVLGKLSNSTIGVVRAFDFLEHVPPSRVVELMNLVWQKLVPGGLFLTMTPAVCDDAGRCGRGATQDPTHISFWSSNSFWYYTDYEFAKHVPAITCRFQTVAVENGYPSDFHKTHLIPYVRWDGMAIKDEKTNYLAGPRKI